MAEISSTVFAYGRAEITTERLLRVGDRVAGNLPTADSVFKLNKTHDLKRMPRRQWTIPKP